ncbi:hypothetical protein [Phenylobacterium sp.]|uniref:hypothetical protein n=1 Tax=Phenylobacterium sp. TaxID=1871053 RepID=UPI002ED9D191
MRGVAFRLGMALGGEAERVSDLDRKLKLFEAFHQCFASVRLSIALDLRLKKAPAQPAEAEQRESERDEAPDWNERPERSDALHYTERDRETERASFPRLLRTLNGVLSDAEQLLPDAPEVPQLRTLLAKAKPEPAPVRPPPSRDLRSRLAASTTTQVLTRPGLRTPPPRRSTGPP